MQWPFHIFSIFRGSGNWQSLSSWRLQWQVLWVFFLLFRIHLIGMTKSKHISFKPQQFFLQIIFQEVLLFGKFLVNSEFWFYAAWIQPWTIHHSTSSQQQITTNQVSWWSANSNLIGLDFTVYFLIFWLADFEYPALLIGLELLLRSLHPLLFSLTDRPPKSDLWWE